MNTAPDLTDEEVSDLMAEWAALANKKLDPAVLASLGDTSVGAVVRWREQIKEQRRKEKEEQLQERAELAALPTFGMF